MCRSSSRNTGSKYGQTAVRLKVQIAMLRRLARCTSRPAVPHMERRKLEDADGISREEVRASRYSTGGGAAGGRGIQAGDTLSCISLGF